MTVSLTALTGARVFHRGQVLQGYALLIEGDRIQGCLPEGNLPSDVDRVALGGGLLVPGFVDLQVNGGDGILLDGSQTVDDLRRIAAAHARIGATSILPTLITAAPEQVGRTINVVAQAVQDGVPGIIGLHLEGPHLAPARKGAHDRALIRPMTDADLQLLLAAARRLPLLKVTLAPENVTTDQIAALGAGGVLVSLGHTDASYADCLAAVEAGARCVTHLFNAQSQMGNREPGVVGAALALGGLSAGLIADGIHVHPATMQSALRAKIGPGQIFLVSDAMATAGSDIDSFTLNGREIRREGNRLTLADGTLAGAHLELATAVRNLVLQCQVPLDRALAMATTYPAELVGMGDIGTLTAGALADVLHLDDALTIRRVWQHGQPVAPLSELPAA